MKYPLFEKLIEKASRQVGLSTAEREKMRFVLREYAAFKPRRVEGSTVFLKYRAVIVGLWTFIRRPAPSLALVVLCVVTASGGVAVAAEKALPGDMLYPIKVAVLEPARTSLALSIEARAAWQRTLAERRLNEAAMLAQQGTLSATAEITLLTRFERSANAATRMFGNSQYATETADMSSANFAARLSAYESILTEIDNVKGSDTTGAFRSAIRAQIEKAASTTPAAGDELDVIRLKTAANSALGASADLLGSVNDTLATSASSHAQRALKDAEALTEQGNKLLEKRDAEGASDAFKNALRATARLDVFTRAAATLDVDAFATNPATATVRVLPKKNTEPRN